MGQTLNKYPQTLMFSRADGAVLTAAARATALPASAKLTLEPGYFGVVGKAIRVRASGRISCVITTPGTARFDLVLTSPVPTSVIVFDSLAMNLNIVAKTNVHWALDVTLACGVIGTTAQLFPGPASWGSEAVIGSPLPTVGGSGLLFLPVATAPALGTAFDATVANTLDLFFTQTVATGSLTLHEFEVTALN